VGCFSTILLVVVFVLVVVTLIRWFEQIAQAVDHRWWNKVSVLTFMPFMVWFYQSRVTTGRPVPVPHYEPVQGRFGAPSSRAADAKAQARDQPPPGTPKEFLELPKVPPTKPKGAKPAVDPDKIAKLKQKMREQGMLPPEE
jgi:hypothetical protein